MKLLLALIASILLNDGWSFHLGDASSMERDFGHGTQYFNHMAKMRSWSGTDPTSLDFTEDSTWRAVNLPHDWAVDLPYSAEASHSHGYKCIGWKYPENSVGWYRRSLDIPSGEGRWFVEFEGIYRDYEVYINGAYIGGERSGYASREYELTDYLRPGQPNLLAVRVDASLEEGWYYEGAGIYRDVRLRHTGPAALEPYAMGMTPDQVGGDYSVMPGCDRASVSSRATFFDASGAEVSDLSHPWSPEDPYLYTVRIELLCDGVPSDVREYSYGVRSAVFDPEQGFLLNGSKYFLKGANIHQDAAGVGIGVPDEVWRYRIARLKEFGFNAIRTSHNPASPSLLRICDEMGMLVIEEVRQFGSYPEALGLMSNMIGRDRNHPCVVAWSIGNEEWASGAEGAAVARRMVALAHSLDPSRPTTYGNSGGEYAIDDEVDVPGYNYIRQNHIDQDHAEHPGRSAIGTEETTGAGVRSASDYAPARKRNSAGPDYIAEGYKFYSERPWTAGVFFWTGFDYRGEPNPQKWPNTGSLYGIFDYCGFPKAQAWELRGLWSLSPKTPQTSTKSRGSAQKRGQTSLAPHKNILKRDGQDVVVIDIVSDAPRLEVSVEGADLLGWGNGDPQFKYVERPLNSQEPFTIYLFAGRAQILIRSVKGLEDPVKVRVGSAEVILQ